MNRQLIEDIAAAVLYEGYLLYPYRASAIKNRQRWNFGVLYPPAYAGQQAGSDTSEMRTECLLRASPEASPKVRIRFLHLIAQTLEGQQWQGAMPREIEVDARTLSELASQAGPQNVAFPGGDNLRPLEAVVEIEGTRLADNLYKLSVSISNTTVLAGSTREQALMQSLVSTHTILGIEGGEFISLLDPPDELRVAAAACANRGTWPVLAGEEGHRDAMLSSPIILYDYPQIAPESAGDLFDGTEIDEILALRILTMTDDEKLEVRNGDDRARKILERTEMLPLEHFQKLHGALRGLTPSSKERA